MNKYIITQEILQLKNDIEEYLKTITDEDKKPFTELYKHIQDFTEKTGLQDE